MCLLVISVFRWLSLISCLKCVFECIHALCAGVAEWLGNGLQIEDVVETRLCWFESGPRLHIICSRRYKSG